MAKYLEVVNGVPTNQTTAAAGGVGNANKIPSLDGTGRFTSDMMPTGIAPDSVSVLAFEALAAGDFVNVYNDAGTAKVRKADATSPAKYATGYVLTAVASGGTAAVFSDDLNDQVTAQTPGDIFLSVTTPGKTQFTAPIAAGQITQKLGFASSATLIKVEICQHYALT